VIVAVKKPGSTRKRPSIESASAGRRDAISLRRIVREIDRVLAELREKQPPGKVGRAAAAEVFGRPNLEQTIKALSLLRSSTKLICGSNFDLPF
jgi:hypothetical protein